MLDFNKKEMLYKHLPTMTVEDYYKYLDEVDNGYIKITKHPENEDIVILNYTEKATFEKRWNKETMSSRGLILDLTEATNNDIIYILARPFDKFPNYGSNEIIDYEDDINFDEVDYVMEKMDGSLGISYFFNDEIRFATRGSFTSEQAIKATEIWREKYAQHESLTHYVTCPVTYLVEIIYPENRVVVDYKGAEELVMLGTIYLFGTEPFLDVGYGDIEWEATRLHMRVAPKYELTIEKMLELKKTLSANEEGFIIRFKNGKRVKIKGDEYLQVHRIKHGMSTKAKYKAWADGTLEAYIMMLPEEFRPELEKFGEQLDKFKNAQYFMLQMLYEQAIDKHKDRKEFALHVKSIIAPDYHKHMFRAYQNGVVDEQMIKDDIFKNYDQYEEVIAVWNKQDS
jgi:RNA ligase